MKPDFALSLSFDGIGLLLRGPNGWLRAGEVSPESTDLAADLAGLRRTALGLRPDGFVSKLIIPDAQIRYLALDTGDVDDRLRARMVRDALDGATPYAVEELVFDWQAAGGTTHAAAVARETLEEAEAFALHHRLNPVSFVAAPQDGGFTREVHFGETSAADEVLPRGARVERDADPVVVTGDAPLPDAPAAESAEPPPEARAAAAAETRGPAASAASPSGASRQPSEPAAAAPAATGPAAAEPPDGTVTGGADRGDSDAPAARAAPVDDRAGTPPGPDAEDPDAAARAPAARQDTMTPATGRAEDPPGPEFRSARGTPGSAPRKAPPGAPALAFTSVRRAEPPPEPPLVPRVMPEAGNGATGSTTPSLRPAPGTPTPEAAARRDLILRRIASQQAAPAGQAAEPDAPDAPAASGGETRPSGRADDEAARLTRFGERKAPSRGRPRRRGALAATAAAVLGLLAIGAYSAVFTDSGLARLLPAPETSSSAARPESVTESPSLDTAPDASRGEDLPRETSGAPEAEGEAAGAPDLAAREAPQPLPDAAETPEPAQRALDPDEAAARYAATGIWEKAPERPAAPAAGRIAGLSVAGTDDALTRAEAVALRTPEAATEAPPRAPVAPPPPGTVFDLDARGLVVATPEGAVTPQGVRVIAGRPPAAPPLRASPEERRAAEAAAAAAARRAALAEFRPIPRPAGLADTPAEVEEDAAAPTGAADIRAAGPPLRPGPIAPGGPERDVEQADDAGTAPIPESTGTRQAVRASPGPAPRPGGFGAVVAAAPAAAAPEAPTVAPDIPSSASVARAATVTDAIELRRLNLIGVYGDPANRRALVRLSNGSYEKVEVGDRLDGGRISAIGEDQLRYVKNGRNLVLRMPQG
ncbi:hypothetical protein [Rhodosalinus sp.]|uniref:hypothetical protein n=1 Tax=Rhodosalinus sp. TaxID=2047741 RepID=UPI0035632DD0